MDEEYLSDLSSSYEEEKPMKRKKVNHSDVGIPNSNINNNNNDNDNDNDNSNANSNAYDSYHTNINTNFNNIFMEPRIREQQELEEAIRLSLLDQEKKAYIVPKYEDNFINRKSRNNRNFDDSPSSNYRSNIHPQMGNQSINPQHHHKHRHRNHENSGSNNNQNHDAQNRNSEVSIEQIILQSKKEEEDTKTIRDFISNRQNLHETLEELPGVDSNDPCFEQFFE